ncbi:polysaccharide biosynthesis protein [Floccifex sp.]|uniref:polysaccharide biosynthesis protein n=1 Tax=Floccifex sp. TaxID=2815810 RepID=UPI003F0DFEE4
MDNMYQTSIYQKYRSALIILIDLFITFCSYVLVFLASNSFFLHGGFLHFTKYIIFGMIFVMLLHLMSELIFKQHKSLWTYTGPRDVFHSFYSFLFCLIIMSAFSHFFHLFKVQTFVMAEGLTYVLQMGIRLFYRYLHSYLENVDRTTKALIIGAGNGGYLMLNEIYRNNRYPYHVVGFLDDFKAKGTIVSGKKVLGTIDEVNEIVEKYDVKQLFISITNATDEQKQRIIELCANTSCNTKIMRFSLENENEVSVDDISIEDLLNRHSIDLKTEEIGSYLENKVVCVTGAGGSIGSELCRQIVKFNPKQLIMVDINENSLYMLKQEFLRNQRDGSMSKDIQMESLIISIREREDIFKLMKQFHPEVVYHAAAHKHVPLMEDRPMEAIRNNVFGTKNVIDACIENGVKRFIMISTDKAVNPTNVMGATKRMTELIMQSRECKSDIKMAAVRFGNVLGSNGSVIPIFKEQIKQGGPVTVTDYNIQRYFMTIPEAAQLVLQAGFYAKHREIFVLDMGQPVKILDLAEKMIRLAGKVPYKDIDIQEIGLRPGEKMFEELALEIEKCHKTDNNLIYVHEKMDVSQEEIDKKLEILQDIVSTCDDNAKIKDVLMEAIL